VNLVLLHAKLGATKTLFPSVTVPLIPGVGKGGGDSHLKRAGVLVENFGKKPPRGTKVLFCGRGFNFFFSPIRVTNSETTH